MRDRIAVSLQMEAFMGKKLQRINGRLRGLVEYNDGVFAEVQTYGVEGIERDILLATIQIHRCEIGDAPEEFLRNFQVGMWLEICTTTEIKVLPETNH
jgi:hypothetical protein